ncbi:hypothetical protein AB4205_04280 [Vibrio sp. 10N.286.49.F3]|uniref:hypothetical protein n=1 Tax=Vibrio sp. 10N.286.49.F3 TaxID=3229704 RepID=UPI00354B0B49
MDLFGSTGWTLDKCLKEAERYFNKGQFQEQSPVAFIEAKKQGFMGEIEAYYAQLSAPEVTDETTYEEIRKVAATTKSAAEFRRIAPAFYNYATDNNHIPTLSRKFWQKAPFKALVFKARSQFSSFTAWREANPETYKDLLKKGHRSRFVRLFYPNLDYKKVLMDSTRYSSREVWMAGSPDYFEWAKANGLCQRICAGRIFFRSKVLPVGFSNDLYTASKRVCQAHSVRINECSKVIIANPRDHKRNWTKERAAQEALKHTLRSKFQKSAWSAYQFIMDNGLYDELCSHFVENTPKAYWTEDRVRLEASNYISVEDFYKYSSSAYHAASRLGILASITETMTKKHREPYTLESAKELAKNYKTMPELRANASGLHNWLVRYPDKKAIDTLLTEAGVERGTPKGALTKEYCASIAQDYTDYGQFRDSANNVYIKCAKEGWLQEVTSHMRRARLPRGYWTEERCWEYFEGYEGEMEKLKKGFSGCATAIRRFGLLEEFRERFDAVKALS